MGGGQSKEEQLYQAVQNSNHTAVKSLRRDGTSLEWVDKEGRTPLILACTKSELFDMVITLLNLGASIKAYRPGHHGGYPLHHAAKRGLDKTVILLLSRGADPMALNDDGQSALDMARNRGHTSVVRILEDRISLFSGVMREISGPGFLEALAPQWVTRKVWAVVLPASSPNRRLPRSELVVYHSPKVSLPRTVIPLNKVQIEEPNFSASDPMMVLIDKSSKTRFKFLSEFEGRRHQLEKFYRACKGFAPQQSTSPQQPTSPPQESPVSVSPTRRPSRPSRVNDPPITIVTPKCPPPPTPPTIQIPPPQPPPQPQQQQQQHQQQQVSTPTSTATEVSPQPRRTLKDSVTSLIPEDVALAMAINASIQSANAEGLTVQADWGGYTSPTKSLTRRRNSGDAKRSPSDSSDNNKWGPFGGSPEAGPSRVYQPPPPPVLSTGRVSSREKIENIWETRPMRNGPPVRNVPVLTTPSGSVQQQEQGQHQTQGPALTPSLTPVLIPVSTPTPTTVTSTTSSPPTEMSTRPTETSTTSVPASTATNSENTPSSKFSLFGVKKKAAVNNNEEGSKATGQCVVCWDAPARGVCIPCGHLAGCMTCLMEIKEKTWGCPVCRTSIQQVIKVFTV